MAGEPASGGSAAGGAGAAGTPGAEEHREARSTHAMLLRTELLESSGLGPSLSSAGLGENAYFGSASAAVGAGAGAGAGGAGGGSGAGAGAGGGGPPQCTSSVMQ
jgi:hypothetical protein